VKQSDKKAISLLLTLVFLATGCTDNKVAEAEALRVEISKVKADACETWANGVVAGGNVRFVDTVYMPDIAAKKFSNLSALDPAFEYAGKAAFILTALNGSRVPESLKPTFLLALADVKRACS
jgi:hypothetical protein